MFQGKVGFAGHYVGWAGAGDAKDFKSSLESSIGLLDKATVIYDIAPLG